MGLKIDSKELNKFLKQNNIAVEKPKKSSKTEAQKRLRDSIDKLSALQKNDEIFFNKDCTKCAIRINDVLLLSNNTSLRLGARQMKDYKSLWIDRIKSLVDDSMLKKWSKTLKGRKMLIEFCYEVNWDYMDYDGRISAFKAPLDGLEKSGLLIDDSWRHLSMILGKQRKSKDKKPNLIMMISVESDEERYFSDDFNDFLGE